MNMKNKDKVREIIKNSSSNTVSTKQVTNSGINRGVLKELVDCGEIYRVGRGLYIQSEAWEDDFYLLQQRYSRGIYSYDTALYLLGYSGRTPFRYTMTFPKGYNSPSIKYENINIKRVILDNYSFGIIKIKSPCGNDIYVYDLERTLCDILRGNGIDIQIINQAMKKYALSKNKNIHKFMQYAEKLHVKSKVLQYLNILL